MIILGAGMAGLLAGNLLRRFSPTIFEAQPSLPNNHHAVLRFRTDAVSVATHIPFRKVHVFKDIVAHSPDLSILALGNLYAAKVTGRVLQRSLSIEAADRYIAPPDFIVQLASGVKDIRYNVRADAAWFRERLPELVDRDIVISTLPMPVMMELVDWPKEYRPTFEWLPIWTVTAVIEFPQVDVFQTLYYPDPHVPWYRASITGNRLIVETTQPAELDRAQLWVTRTILPHFGLDRALVSGMAIARQEYGKLLPLEDDQARRAFILALTDQYNIYSLGRFATWRQILLDDVVKDIALIDRMISERDTYSRRLGEIRNV